MKINAIAIVAAAALFAGCAGNNDKNQTTGIDTGLAADIKHHIAVLANDSLMGRKPFTKGEEKTINYIAAEYKKS